MLFDNTASNKLYADFVGTGFELVDPDTGLTLADFGAGEALLEKYCRDPASAPAASRAA